MFDVQVGAGTCSAEDMQLSFNVLTGMGSHEARRAIELPSKVPLRCTWVFLGDAQADGPLSWSFPSPAETSPCTGK